jgi:hypothetical protein
LWRTLFWISQHTDRQQRMFHMLAWAVKLADLRRSTLPKAIDSGQITGTKCLLVEEQVAHGELHQISPSLTESADENGTHISAARNTGALEAEIAALGRVFEIHRVRIIGSRSKLTCNRCPTTQTKTTNVQPPNRKILIPRLKKIVWNGVHGILISGSVIWRGSRIRSRIP